MQRIRRLSLAAIAVIALVALVATSAVAKPRADAPARQAPGKTRLIVDECRGAALYADRKLTFKSTMSTIDAGGKMEMRFSLYRRYIGQRRFKRVPATDQNGLETWLSSSEPAVTSYVHNLAVTPVETRAHYRAKVRYRWSDSAGKIVAAAKRVSALCKQSRALPDLVINKVSGYPNPGAASGDPFSAYPAIYEVELANRGHSSVSNANGIPVSASLNGAALLAGPATTELNHDQIPARGTYKVVFYGPKCPGLLEVAIDPQRLIRETSRRNNRLSVGC
ncbi:MAG: hypothetical protein WAP37_04775 [Solirubrobacterales bacterium]